jgi:site-specific recombinase XerD
VSQPTAAALSRYRVYLSNRALSENSIRSYTYILRQFQGWLGRSIIDAGRDEIEGWINQKPLSPRARYTYISTLAGFYRWAIREELAEKDPTVYLDRPRLPRSVPRPMAVADLHHALNFADLRMRAWLMLAAYDGLRCQEIAGLRVDDLLLTFEPPMLVVSAAKGRRQRIVPLNREVEKALVEFGIPRAGYLFIRQDRPRSGQPILPRSVSEYIGNYLHGLGINATAHMARHLFATTVYRLTNNLRLVQELLGHSSPSTTAGYTAYSATEASAVVRDLQLTDERVADAAALLLHEMALDDGGDRDAVAAVRGLGQGSLWSVP